MKKLSVRYTQENLYCCDVEEELTKILSEEISKEIDKSIFNKLFGTINLEKSILDRIKKEN